MNVVRKRRCAESAAVPAASVSTPVAKVASSPAPSAGSASVASGLITTKSVKPWCSTSRATGSPQARIGKQRFGGGRPAKREPEHRHRNGVPPPGQQRREPAEDDADAEHALLD